MTDSCRWSVASDSQLQRLQRGNPGTSIDKHQDEFEKRKPFADIRKKLILGFGKLSERQQHLHQNPPKRFQLHNEKELLGHGKDKEESSCLNGDDTETPNEHHSDYEISRSHSSAEGIPQHPELCQAGNPVLGSKSLAKGPSLQGTRPHQENPKKPGVEHPRLAART